MESSQGRFDVKRTVANRSPRTVSIVALLALAPVVLFVFGRSALAVVAAVNVVLIFGSLYLLTSPAESDHGHEARQHGERDREATDERTDREEAAVEADDSTA